MPCLEACRGTRSPRRTRMKRDTEPHLWPTWNLSSEEADRFYRGSGLARNSMSCSCAARTRQAGVWLWCKLKPTVRSVKLRLVE